MGTQEITVKYPEQNGHMPFEVLSGTGTRLVVNERGKAQATTTGEVLVNHSVKLVVNGTVYDAKNQALVKGPEHAALSFDTTLKEALCHEFPQVGSMVVNEFKTVQIDDAVMALATLADNQGKVVKGTSMGPDSLQSMQGALVRAYQILFNN